MSDERGADSARPAVVSHYELGELLGGGAMGTVYMATDRRDGGKLAIKLLNAALAADAEFRERFEREAHVAALLRSPYVVHLLDYGEDEGRYFIAMEYVEGQSLREALELGPLPLERALRIAAQVARALEEGEARGVVHRDIKPDNILLRDGDSVKVADFGIARQMGAGTLTAAGALVGTLAYAAPEMAHGEADQRSDIYALGATLYHTLTGRPPYEGTALEMLRHHAETPLPLEPLRGLPPTVIEIIKRCLEKKPESRYQRTAALAGDLEHARSASRTGASAAETVVRPSVRQPEPLASTVVRKAEAPSAEAVPTEVAPQPKIVTATPVLGPAEGDTGPAVAAPIHAGFGIRLVAAIIDVAILAIPNLVIAAFAGATAGTIILTVVWFIYLTAFWATRGATPGKMVVGVEIVTKEGDQIGFGRTMLRYVGYVVAWCSLGLGFLMIAFNREKRGIHDYIAGTVVVRRGRNGG